MDFNRSNTESEPLEEMRAYYDTVYDITSDCQNRLIPDNAMNVLDFIQLELPKTTSAILTYSAKTLFSKESPTEDIQCPTSRNIPSVTVIAAASNVGVQLFQQVYRNHFQIFHESPGSPRIKRYALIQSSYFLCTLSNLPKLALGRLGEILLHFVSKNVEKNFFWRYMSESG